ncbi:unnamed protein product [Lymnaea stagnalis]|uniref:Conopressin/neurophysin n=2 Tax=Lymnaea stagnalis TaxID=6523 RepID=CONO_LYMST|nr:RecName: Full=Conopressin/neurophysin; Contains: RecName: Full=Lys-conopressin G; Contains: RecName: Full=Neurophysin; Flags: Precursor [Lymnaea stagnalis]AAA29289.1 preproconopressin [Lymnaea stagnalis]AAB35220.1 conopressin [Lymnaea stagnalis]
MMSSLCGMPLTYLLTAAVLSLSLTDACFIRNCPKGGKRSLDTGMVTSRECMKCGPGGTGQCVGPSICCGQDFGCHVGTAEAAVCQQENDSSTPCLVKGEACGSRDAGNCVADGICCDSESCAVNDRCRDLDGNAQANRGDLIQLIHKLLKVRDYD